MPDRITLSRAKGWRKPEGAIVVARPSIWGNPWGIGTPGTITIPPLSGGKARTLQLDRNIERDGAVGSFDLWLRSGFRANPYSPTFYDFSEADLNSVDEAFNHARWQVLANLHELRGHDLCCWCKPGHPCHADVLLRAANGGEG